MNQSLPPPTLAFLNTCSSRGYGSTVLGAVENIVHIPVTSGPSRQDDCQYSHVNMAAMKIIITPRVPQFLTETSPGFSVMPNHHSAWPS